MIRHALSLTLSLFVTSCAVSSGGNETSSPQFSSKEYTSIPKITPNSNTGNVIDESKRIPFPNPEM
jgi:hypothetical protein